MTDIPTRVKTIISEHLGVTIKDVEEDVTFKSLGADSLDTIELAMAFEEEFDIEVDNEIANTMLIVADSIAIVYELS